MGSHLEMKQFFKDCVKTIQVYKYDYINEIKQMPEYARLAKEYDNVDEIIYMAEDKIEDIRRMKNIIADAKKNFKTPPDYGLIKFYLLVKHKSDTTRFLLLYGDNVLRDIAERKEQNI